MKGGGIGIQKLAGEAKYASQKNEYDVHFAPFPYRPGTKTTILYTTQRA